MEKLIGKGYKKYATRPTMLCLKLRVLLLPVAVNRIAAAHFCFHIRVCTGVNNYR